MAHPAGGFTLTHARRYLAIASAIAAVTAVAACGGSSAGATGNANSTSGGTAQCASQASSAVNSAGAIPGGSLPTPIASSNLRGKLVVAIPETLSIPDDGVWVNGIKSAAKVVGARVQVIDGGATPSGETRAIQQAISLRPAAVATYGVVTSNVSGALQSLDSAKIPLVAYAPGIPTVAKYSIDNDWPGIGKLEADYVLARTNCKADALIFTSSIFTNITVEVNSTVAEFKRLCPSCQARVINVDVTKLATSVTPQTVAALQRDPNVNFIIGAFDALATYIIPGVQQAGAHVKVISNTGTQQNVENVKNGNVQIADIEAVPTAELGWATMDDMLRAASGQPSAKTWNPLPTLLITSHNVDQASAYLTNSDYVSKFKAEW